MGMFAVVMALAAVSASAAGATADCWDSAQTQSAMNDCARKDYEAADREMNVVYKKLMAQDDPVFRKKVQAAQRAWLTYRDAHVDSVYPDAENATYGSVRPMCVHRILADMTTERTAQLRRLLEPEAGDVCGGGPAPKK
jgi:uncharacterized protein YecT (DUF1311 family)